MTDNSTMDYGNSEISWPRPLRFWLLIVFDVPAILCSLFVLYHLLSDRTLRHALHNHTIIVLLILALVCQLIDVSWYLDFILRGVVWPQTPARCLVWWLVDLGFYNTASIILAWSSIERHILVFHNRWVSTQKKRLVVHYLPLFILLVYATIYYTVLIFFPPCKNTFVYTLPVCAASPCHLLHPVFGIWEMAVHGCLCTIIIAFSSISLLVRVIIYKRRRNRALHWRKYSKMIFQLVYISTIYLVFNLPIMVLLLARMCGLPANVAVAEQLVTFFLTYWVMLLLPIVTLTSLSNKKKRISDIVHWQRQHHATVLPGMIKVVALATIQQQYETQEMK